MTPGEAACYCPRRHMPPESLLLAVVVFLAFLVEASLGFGSSVVTVALGSLWMPLDELLPAFLPVNLALSGYLVARYRAHVDGRYLLRRVLPAMGLGLPAGYLVFSRFAGQGLKAGLGAFIVVLSLSELWRLARPAGGQRPLSRLVERVALFAGGMAHGAFASGGPLAVWVSGRVLEEKAGFRATLSCMWLSLNLVLVAGYLFDDLLTGATLRTSALLVPSLAVGIVAGEWAHHRIPLRTFRVGVFVLLLGVGALLLLRG